MYHGFLKSIAAIAVSAVLISPLSAATLNIHNGGDPTSLDPHKVSGDWENRIVGDIFEGLLTEDRGAQPIPGQAESWTISDDGLTYTFNLRDGIVWTDGTPVTAGDFEFAIKRLMDPATAADYAYLQYPIKNAEEINGGTITDFDELGVKALDDKTLEITLKQPTPYFLGALTHYTAYPLPQHVVEEQGSNWVRLENIVTNGPYKPTEWVPGSHVTTVMNDTYYDAANLKIESAKFFVLEDESAALKRYRAGDFDIMTEFPTDQYEWMKTNMPGEPQVAAFAGLYYYVVNHNKPPFDNADVRQALAMSINREVIGPQILGTNELPAYSWVPPGMAHYGEPAHFSWKDLTYGEKVTEAKALLEKAGFNAANPLALQLRYNTNENHKRIAVAIAAMWKQIGIDVSLYNTEVKVHYDELQRNILDIGRAGWLADYNDPHNFLNLLETGIPNNYGRFSNAEYDALMDESNGIVDLDKRAELMKQAEQIALDQTAAIPIYYYLSRNVVSPKVMGFENNVFDIHRTRWLELAE